MLPQKIVKAASILAILVLLVVILVYAKPFLVPLTFAAILSMLMLPLVKWFQSKGIAKGLSILICILLLLLVFGLIISFIGWQLSSIASDATKLEQQLTSKYDQAKEFIAQKLGIPPEKQQQMLQKQQGSSMANFITGFLAGVGGFVANFLLVLVYIFLLLYFRDRLKGFILRLVPKTQERNAVEAVDGAQKVAQKYLTGLFMMIVCLWIMYSIGFSIVGVKNPFFFAILCGILEIVPFVGNLLGTSLTLLMSLVQGGGMDIVIGILIVYAVVQFLQSYILEPLVVGAEVNINPLFTIVAIVAGELLWGVPGMVLAIPLLGIAKIVCEHVEPLKPYAYLIGDDKKKESGFARKMKEFKSKAKNWFK